VSSAPPPVTAPSRRIESRIHRVTHGVADWLRGEEARDAALPAAAFVAAVHLLAVAATAAAAAVDRAGTAPAGIDLAAAWTHWDVGHYLGIAADGYSATELPERIVFFPLFPVLIRLGSVVAPPLLVASAISAAATVAAVVGVYRLARMDGTRTLARWSVAFLLAYPASFSLVAPYTEGLFLAAAAWSRAAFRAYFTRGVLLNEPAALKALAAESGLDADAAEAAWNDPVWKARLKAECDAAVAAGIFGAPFFIVDGEPFWGNDRRPQIERWLSTGPF